ncbi:kinase-like protein [Cenococcum geophilum]
MRAAHNVKDLVSVGVTAIITRLNAVKQLFNTMWFIYLRSVFYGDILYNNIFLNNNLNILAIDDYLLLVYYKTSHKLLSEDILTKTELFALGSTTYKIMTGLKLYKDLPNYEISTAFSEGRYLNLESVFIFRNIIIGYIKLEVATIKEPRIYRFHTLFSR